MSALPPKADMCGALAHVCFVPIADIREMDLRGQKSKAAKRSHGGLVSQRVVPGEEICLKRKPSLSDPAGALGNPYAMVLVRCVAQSIGIAKRRALLKDYRVEMPA
jgi:hypothetical protein